MTATLTTAIDTDSLFGPPECSFCGLANHLPDGGDHPCCVFARQWTASDVRTLRVVGELRHLGADIATLRLVPEVLEHHAGEGWLLVGPGRVRLCTIEELVDALERDEPSWHVVRLTTVLHGLPTDDDAAAA